MGFWLGCRVDSLGFTVCLRCLWSVCFDLLSCGIFRGLVIWFARVYSLVLELMFRKVWGLRMMALFSLSGLAVWFIKAFRYCWFSGVGVPGGGWGLGLRGEEFHYFLSFCVDSCCNIRG